MKILNIVGARPNFIKIAPLHRALEKYTEVDSKVIHTGQHYDKKMSDIFFEQLEMPVPDYYLGVGSGSHTQVTAKIMVEFETIVHTEKPDVVLVVGDVNSTLACALVASKMGIPLIHVEAGLRSGDRNMPEEINRIITDNISDYLFVTEQSGMINLAKENVPDEKIFFVGNVMIDSLCFYRQKAAKISILKDLGIAAKAYLLMTIHRPSNVDNRASLSVILDIIKTNAKVEQKIIFPIHPRTKKNMEKFGLLEELEGLDNLVLLEPQGYLEFLHLMENAALIVTDSGGIQEETTFLQVPCLTIRSTTERPVTIELGTNTLLEELNAKLINDAIAKTLSGETKKPGLIPPLWDGHAADRIAEQVVHLIGARKA